MSIFVLLLCAPGVAALSGVSVEPEALRIIPIASQRGEGSQLVFVLSRQISTAVMGMSRSPISTISAIIASGSARRG